MRDIEDLVDFWYAHANEELVMATLVRKQHSGYRGVGAKKIISQNDACGLLSGGCLETEINWFARASRNDLPMLKTFSTMGGGDRFLGYKTGCAGMIDVLFESLPTGNSDKTLYIPYGPKQQVEGVVVELGAFNLGRRRFVSMPLDNQFNLTDVFVDPWIEPLTLCIVGCGPDAPALFNMAKIMGWQVLLLDYRPDFIETGHLTTICPLEFIAAHIPEGPRVAVVLMTHNYEADLRILHGLNDKHLGYLGCLGPAKRFDQLRSDLFVEYGTSLSLAVESIVHAPAGLLPKGRSPEEIALSITAEIQSVMRLNPSLQPCPA